MTTEYVRDSLLWSLVDVPDDRILILPCGVDVDEYRPEADAEVLERYGVPERFVICPGAVTELKGTPNVVAATRTTPTSHRRSSPVTAMCACASPTNSVSAGCSWGG